MPFRRQFGRTWLSVLVGVGVTLVVLMIGAWVALSHVDWNKHVAAVAAEIKQATGRDLAVAGRVDVGLLPLRLIARQVSFSNAPWGSRPQMITAKRVEIHAALLPLLTGELRLSIDIEEPDVLLESDPKGMGNWVMRSARNERKHEPPPDSSGSPVHLDAARLTKAVIRYRAGDSGDTHRFAFTEAVIVPAGSSGERITVKGEINGAPVSLDATTDDYLIDTLGAGEALGIDLKVTATGATLAAAGRIGFPPAGPQLALKLRATADDTGPLRKTLGLRLPRLELEGQLDAAKQIYAIKGVKVSMGKSTASGTFKADLSGARPRISAEVAAALIDLLEVRALQKSTAASRGESTTASRRIFSSEPLPIAALGAVDADARLAIDRLVLPPEILLEAVRGRITLTSGKLETRALDMRVGGGDLKLTGGLDATGTERARVSATLTGNDIDLGKMMAALGGSDLIRGGRTELKVEMHSAGASPAALAAGLDGRILAVMGPARTRNRVLDQAGANVITQVLNAVNPLRNKEPYTQIQCAVVNVPVRDGVITVDRTAAVETSHVGVAMAGTVNLADETLDLSIRPQAKEGIGVSIGGLANLVKVSGSLADPKVGVDVAGAAGAAAQIGVGVVTGGLSILAKGLFDKATMQAPCKTALQTDEEQPAAGGIGSTLQGLFK